MTPSQQLNRSATMRAVKRKNTGPEMRLRRALHAQGYRYRLHRKELPGNPDIVFPTRRKAIFVHGCFWHGHGCKRGARVPKTNTEYWVGKIRGNVERDGRHQAALAEQGWSTLIVWECELRDMNETLRQVRSFLECSE